MHSVETLLPSHSCSVKDDECKLNWLHQSCIHLYHVVPYLLMYGSTLCKACTVALVRENLPKRFPKCLVHTCMLVNFAQATMERMSNIKGSGSHKDDWINMFIANRQWLYYSAQQSGHSLMLQWVVAISLCRVRPTAYKIFGQKKSAGLTSKYSKSRGTSDLYFWWLMCLVPP